jgi:copper chaperone
MAQTIFHVPDITCGHCQLTITKALTPLAGVRSVAVDIATKRVTVDYDETAVGEGRLQEVLAEEDYPVASVAAPSSAISDSAGSA